MTASNNSTVTLTDADLADIERRAEYATQGTWELQTSNSMRRIGTQEHDGSVLYATQSRHDGVIDLGGPYSNLEYIVRMQPQVAKALVSEIRMHRDRAAGQAPALSPIPMPWPERRKDYPDYEQPHSDHLQGLELADWRQWGARVRFLTQRLTPAQVAQMSQRENDLEELMHKHEMIGVMGDNPKLEAKLLAFVSDALALASGTPEQATTTPVETLNATHAARRWCKGDGEWTGWALIDAAEFARRKDDSSFQIVALEPVNSNEPIAAQAVEDSFIVEAVRQAKVLCVHPEAATTIDIGRAVLSAKRRALLSAAPHSASSSDQVAPANHEQVSERHTIEGTVRFQRSEIKPGEENRKCVCCPNGHHIFSRGVKWDAYDTRHPAHFGNGPEVFVSSRVTDKNANEGRRVRLTVEVLDSTPLAEQTPGQEIGHE